MEMLILEEIDRNNKSFEAIKHIDENNIGTYAHTDLAFEFAS